VSCTCTTASSRRPANALTVRQFGSTLHKRGPRIARAATRRACGRGPKQLMDLHQRPVAAAEAPRGKRWRPEQMGTSTDRQDALDMPRAVKSDHYVTVDEQIEG